MPKSQLSLLTGQIGIGLLIFSLIMSVAGFVASYDARRKLAAFAYEGQSVTGTITNNHRNIVSQNQVYWVDVSFQTLDGRFHYASTGVSGMVYGGLRDDNRVKVTYVRSNPDWFYLGNDAPTDRDSAIFTDMYHYGTVASLLILIGLAAFVFWDRDDGMFADQAAGAIQPGGRPLIKLGHRRFGKGRKL
jgi:hypothetical protein